MVVMVRRRTVVPVGYAQVVRNVVPIAAAQNATRTSIRALGIVGRAHAVVIELIPVVNPLPDVAAYIIKAIAISRIAFDL